MNKLKTINRSEDILENYMWHLESTTKQIKENMELIKDWYHYSIKKWYFDLRKDENGNFLKEKQTKNIYFWNGEKTTFELRKDGSIWEIDDDDKNNDIMHVKGAVENWTLEKIQDHLWVIKQNKIMDIQMKIEKLSETLDLMNYAKNNHNEKS